MSDCSCTWPTSVLPTVNDMKTLRRQNRADIDALRSLELFAGCTDAELRAARTLMTSVDVDSGTTLINETDVGRQFFVIQEGTALVSRGGEPVAQLGPGQHFGEMAL